MASEMAAMRKARASRFLENLRVFDDGVSALVGRLLGSASVETSSRSISETQSPPQRS
jgi:hypothetical protein